VNLDPLVSLGDVVRDRPPHRDMPGDALRVIREAVTTGWLTPVKHSVNGRQAQGLWFRRSRVDELWALPSMRYERRIARWIMGFLRDEWRWRVPTIARLFGCSVGEARTQIAWVRRVKQMT
jgi:hypothetical protein